MAPSESETHFRDKRTAPPIDTLVTGGTGLIGRWLLARLTADGRQVGVLVRGGVRRAQELAVFVDAHGGDSQKLTLFDVDIGGDAPLLADLAPIAEVRDVFHLAAAFAFGMTSEHAMHINVTGTLRVAELALRLPRLRRFVALGGYRATRLPAWLSDAGFPFSGAVHTRLYAEHGAYEASKLHAHLALQAFAETNGLPLTSVHPSTVIGDSATGETNQRVGLGDMVERLWRGKMPALVGTAQTFVPVVCVDYLAEFLAGVPWDEGTLGQDLCVLDETTPCLPVLIEEIAAHFDVPAPRRLLSKGVVAALPEVLTGVEKETLTFLSEDRYDTTAAKEYAARVGLSMPARKLALHRWLDYLVATRFLEGEATGGHFVSAAGSQTYVEGDIHRAETLFLHGLPWDGESGRALGVALAKSSPAGMANGSGGNLLVRPDLPSMGRSSASDSPLDVWLESLLASRTRPVRIVAHSLSTGVALRFAARRPKKVSELVLISPFFLQPPAPWWLRCPRLTSLLLRTGNLASFGSQLVQDGGEALPAVQSAYAHLRRPGVALTVASALSRASRERERVQLRQLLSETTVPCCLLYGAGDPLVIDGGAESFAIEGAGHNPHVEAPEAVAQAIGAWRAKRSAAPIRSAHSRQA